jgi:serine/threonine-protein kinase
MSDVRSGRVIAGKYRLESVLARGGMGSVWRARHVMLETPVAIKFIGADVFSLPEARRRFEREAKAAALLQSPHVVRIHDYGLEGDLPYLVMELLTGEDLGMTLKRQGKLPPEDTANIVFQVARALRRAAEAGIVHRDLKPSNVFIIHDDDEDLVKVLDFGIAKAPRGLRSDDESTRKGAIIGSPRYMSPEQARGSPLVDPRSDLWSLAVIAYRAVTGDLPFQSLDMTDLIVKICTEDPIPPTRIDPALGPEMDVFFARALDRNPDRRFQTAKELASAFAVAAGQPPPSVSSRRILIRHPSWQLEVPESIRSAIVPPSPSPSLPATFAERPSGPPVSEPAATAVEPGLSPAGRIEGDRPSPSCDATRVSAGPLTPVPAVAPPRASAPRVTPLPKGTPTPCPSDMDVPTPAVARPTRPVLVRRLALGTCAALLLLEALMALAPWRRPAPRANAVPPVIVVPPGAPLDEESAGVPAVEAPPEVPAATASAAAPVPSAAHGSASARTAPIAPGPTLRATPKKKHAILGI